MPTYNLPGFQAEPEAAFWLEYPLPRTPLCVARIEQIIAYTEPVTPAPRLPMFAIDPDQDFPDTPSEFLCQFIELVLLSLTRDKALPTDDPLRPQLRGEFALADDFAGIPEAFSTDQDAADAGRMLTKGMNPFLTDNMRRQLLADFAETDVGPAQSGERAQPFGSNATLTIATPSAVGAFRLEPDVLEAFPMDKLSESVARFGRRCRAQVSPLSAFLNLQCAPFGAIFNVARPGSQVPVADVLDQRQRITLPPAMILTGRELARAFENETPGLFHRHALNWLLFNRTDVSPPRHARIWAALDMAIYSALGAAWHYKWHNPPYRYLLRPREYSSFIDVLFDREVNSTGSGDGVFRTCPTPTPGTPRHPAWPSGHSTYSAAASYVLEYFFAGETSLGRTYQQVLQAARSTPPFGPDWIALHLRRLANNIGEARLFGGVHWRADHVAGQKIGRAAAQVIVDQLKADCVPDFMLRSCPAGAGILPPNPVVLATNTRADRTGTCPFQQDKIDPP